jgi:hypothetical protein
MEELEAVIRLLDEAGEAASRFEVDRRLNASLPLFRTVPQKESEETPVRLATGHAFGYRVEAHREGKSKRLVFEPYFRMNSGVQHPPALEDTKPETEEIWAALAAGVTAAYARARLHHLLFACRHGRPHEHAEAAVRAYLEASRQWSREIETVDDLRTALRLARSIGNRGLAADAVAAMTKAADDALSSSAPMPGMTIGLLESLVDEREPPDEVDALLERAWVAHPDPWLRDQVVDLQLRRVIGGQPRAALEDARVQVWLDAAERAEGLVRAAHFKTALEWATVTGRKDLIERAAAALQTIQFDQLGMEKISVETAIPEQRIETFLAPITEAPGWREALSAFGEHGPITGDSTRNREQVAKDAHRLSNMFSRELMGGDGLPRFHAETDAEKAEVALAQLEGQHMQIAGRLLARGLLEISRRHGVPSEEELTAFFTERPLIGEGLAGALARILIRYWTNDFEGAAFTAAPRVETLVRTLVLATGTGVYRVQRERKPGQYPGLGALLDVLTQRGLDESWFRFVYTLCANPAGWNIRNEISHGFVDDVHAAVSALLIQALLYLSSLEPTETPTSEEPSGDSAVDGDRELGEGGPESEASSPG